MNIKDPNLYPTHSCYDDALENIIWIMKKEGTGAIRRGEVVIVHGIIAPDGKEISHAWLERGDKRVVFTSILDGERVLVEGDLASYYENFKVKESTRYTLFEAYAEELRTGHCGPWKEQYIRLCNTNPNPKENP